MFANFLISHYNDMSKELNAMFEEDQENSALNLSYNAYEYKRVQNGRGVYAWIEHSGLFYNGDIPGVGGSMKVFMASSYEQCLNDLKENLKRSTAIAFRGFRQRESLQEILRKHPTAEIVFIPIN